MNNQKLYLLLGILLISLTSCFPILNRSEIQSYIDFIINRVSSLYLRRNDPGTKLYEFYSILRNESANAIRYSDLYPAVREAIEVLQDRHLEFFEPSDATNFSTAVGFGLLLIPAENIVIRVFPKSSAERAGINVGDKIVLVNGKNFTSGNQISNSENLLEITIFRLKTGKTISYKLERSPFKTNIEPQANVIQKKIGYLEIPGFHQDFNGIENYSTNLQNKMQQLDNTNDLCGWVLDLRRNTGGEPKAMREGLKLLLNSELVGYEDFPMGDSTTKFDHKPITVSDSKDVQLRSKDTPIAVLQSKMTASAGEMVVISLIGRYNTRFFGEKTNGIPTLRKDLLLPDGAVLSVPVAYVADRTGWRYTTSIVPDQDVLMNWEYIENQDQDLVLNAALKWLHLQTSCNPSEQTLPGQTPPKLNP